MRNYTFIASAVLLLTACQKEPASLPVSESEPLDISIYQLIVTPERYDGKRVRVHGFLHLEFEGNGLYAHKEDYERYLSKNGVWIDTRKCGSGPDRGANDAYVLVEATFDSKRLGHGDLWSGTLTNVTRCDVPPDFRNIHIEPEGASNNSFKPMPLRGTA